MEIDIYTDGACKYNPGEGGYAFIICNHNSEELIRDAEAFENTTNNRMELLGVINAFKELKSKNIQTNKVNVYSDSQYIINSFNKHWIEKWQKENFRIGEKNPVKNIDLWKELLNLIKDYTVTWNWVKGHNGNKYNEECDRLANDAIRKLKKDKIN